MPAARGSLVCQEGSRPMVLGSVSDGLCDLGQVTWPLRASVSFCRKWDQQQASLRVATRTKQRSCVRRAVPGPASFLSFPRKPWCSFTAHPTPSNPFPDPHPSSCPLRRLSGSPSSESKLSRSPGLTMRPAVSEQPGWPRGLGFSRAAGAGGCPGQRRAGGGPSGGAGVTGTPPPRPEKTRAGSRQATEAEKGLRAAEDNEGYVCENLRAEGFHISWVPFPGARGRSRGPSWRNNALPVGRFHLRRFAASPELPRASLAAPHPTCVGQ